MDKFPMTLALSAGSVLAAAWYLDVWGGPLFPALIGGIVGYLLDRTRAKKAVPVDDHG